MSAPGTQRTSAKVYYEREAGIDDAPGTTYMSVDSNAILK